MKPAGPAAAVEAPPEKKKRKRGGGRIECDLGLLLGVGGLAASRLGQLWIAFDVFSQFTLQFGVVVAAFAIGRFLPRARLFAAFLLVICGLLAIGVWPHVASRSPRIADVVKAGERAFKVASFNSWYDNEQVELVRGEIERLDADVITLIEFGPNKHGLLKQLAQRYPYQAQCFAVDYCHMAILSKFPLANFESRVNWEGAPMIMAKLGPEFGGLTVIGVHTIRFPHSRAQYRQVKGLAGLIETIPGAKLVMGDFNATPFSRITATIANQTGLRRLTSLPTWPARFGLPQVSIDHIFVSEGIRVVEEERIGEPAGSDHYPITMTLAVPAN